MLADDLRAFYALTRSGGTDNGGRMGAAEVVSGVPGDFYDHLSMAARLALTVEIEKIFLKCHDSDNGSGRSPKVYYDGDAALGDDYCVFYPGTQEDTEADDPFTGAQGYAAGTLVNGVAIGGQSLTIQFKDASQAALPFDGGSIRLTNKTRYSNSGNEQFLTVDAAPTVVGSQVTLHFAETFDYDFAAGCLVSMVYEPAADVECTISDTSATGGLATFDFSTIGLYNIGTIQQVWSFEMQDTDAFILTGDVLGALTTGSISSDFEPQNGDWSTSMLKIPASAFSGLTPAGGDTLSFTTSPASVPIWEVKTNPAGASVTNSNSIWIVLRVESA